MGEPIKKNKVHKISFDSNRRFGIELEVNADDGKNRPDDGKRPKGTERIAAVVQESVGQDMSVEIRGWEHTDGNESWVVKPDSSCGLEICSPPLKGWRGLKKGMQVVEGLSKDGKTKADQRCSVHIHIEISDLSREQIGTILAWWVKCEALFLDAMPVERKRNRYCQFLGMLTNFQHDGVYTPEDVITRVSDVKYYTCNAHMYHKIKRQTVEFRIAEGGGCFDPYLIKNWVRLLIHFMEMTKNLGFPKNYVPPKTDSDRLEVTPWSNLLWLDPKQVFTLLGFNPNPAAIPGHHGVREYELSKALTQTRNWFLGRLHKNMSRHEAGSLRHYAYQEMLSLTEEIKAKGQCGEPHSLLVPADKEELYGDGYTF